MRLKLANHRVVGSDELEPSLRAVVGVHRGARVEVVDVLEGDVRRYVAFFFEGGSAAVVTPGGECVLRAVQHAVEPGADPDLCDAIGAAYAEAIPRIEQTVSFAVPRDAVHRELGTLTFDPGCDSWYADIDGLRIRVSGGAEPDPAELRMAEAIASDRSACVRAVRAVAPGVKIVEVELWKPGTLIAHLDGEPGRVEIPWPPD